MKFTFCLLKAISLSIAMLIFACFSFGQDLDDVSFSGRIVDPNGLAVVGATVTATETVTGVERTVTTNEVGRYRLIELKPGIYKLKASATGFGAKVRADLTTISGQNLQLDFTLSPAGVQAEATVTVGDDDAPVIDTTRTVVGSTITEREIEEIPNNSRNALDLVLTLGGTSEEALSTRDLAEDTNRPNRLPPTEQGNFSISGGASFSNNITIDGLDNNDDLSAGNRFQPSLEAIAEVQVIRNQFSAEYGRASGGRINIRTRGGSNKFRGRAFMFYKNDNLNANTWYNNSRNFPRRDFVDYNPGFTFSGPVILPFGEGSPIYNGRNRTFFFVAYEYDKLNDTTFIDTWLPIVGNPRFELPAPTGTEQFCDSPGSLPPPCVGQVGALASYSKLLDTPNQTHIFTTRIDHRLFDGNDLTFSWQLGRKKLLRTSSTSALTRIEDAVQARNVDTDAFNITDNHVFGANAVNQARYQWSVYEPSYQAEEPFGPVVLIGYRNPDTNSTQTLIAGNSTASLSQSNIFSDSRRETRHQFQDSVTWVAGRHTWKVGADIQHVNSSNISLADATGTYNFANAFNFGQNQLSRYRQNFGTTTDVTNTYWGTFINDEINLNKDVTFTLGVRYERETAVADNNNFGPRVGLAWAPFEGGKGVIRLGAGIFYSRVLLRTVGNFIQNQSGGLASFDTNAITTANGARNLVLASISQDFPNAYPTIEDLQAAVTRVMCGATPCSATTGFLTLNGTGGNPLRTVDPGLKIPESYQFNVGFERQLWKDWVFEANYTWNKGAHLWREYNPNAPVIPAGFDDLTDWLLANPVYLFRNPNGTVRTRYEFFADPTNRNIGLSTSKTSQTNCSTSSSATCYVNLYAFSNSTTAPSVGVGGVGVNSIGSPIGVALEAVRVLRPDQNFDEKERVISVGNSEYQGLVLEMRSRFRELGGGFRSSFRVAYTLSKLMDDGLNNTTNAELGADFSREWARATQDRRHRIAVSGTVETPWWMGKLRFSPLFRYGSSAPFNLGTGVDRNLNDVSTDRPVFTGDIEDLIWREPGTPYPQELADQLTTPPIGANSGTLPRNAGRGPSMYLFDLSLSREFRFTERMRLRPTIEIGNILNARVFSYGSEFVDFFGATPTPTQQSGFLVPSRAYRPRDIRIGFRFDF